MPRHSPCALISLTYSVFTNLEKSNNWFSSYKELCRLIKKLIFYCLAKIVIFLPIIKSLFPLLLPSHNCIIITMFSFQGAFELLRNSMKYLFQGTSVNFLKKKWWAKMDSNHRPHDYQSCALASWAIGPYDFFWWRLAGSNRWPPACKAGALPAELNPRLFLPSLVGTSSAVPSKLNNASSNETSCTDLRTLLVDASLY